MLPFVSRSQQSRPDSLRKILQNASTDIARHNACVDLYIYYWEVNRDSALFYAEKRLTIAKENNQKLAEAFALGSKGYQYSSIGRYSESFRCLLQALTIAGEPKNLDAPGWKIALVPFPGKGRLAILSTTHHIIGGLMGNTENHEQEIFHLKEGLRIATQINFPNRQMVGNRELAIAYLNMNKPDSALYFARRAELFYNDPFSKNLIETNMLTIGNIFLVKGDTLQAKKHYQEGLITARTQNIQTGVAKINHQFVKLFLLQNRKDSALSYALNNLKVIQSIGGISDQQTNMGTAYEDLYLAYKLSNQVDSAFKYQGLALTLKDSLYKVRIRNLADFQKLSLREALRLESLEKEKIQTQSKIRTYGLLAGLTVLSIIGFILYRNNRQKQKANKVLESTLTNLKSTQSQLIQSEKMASLGELTAGIAHEIQNPLNFVNNFSEVSTELVDEMNEELDKGNLIDAKEIANDLKQNLEKINHHGKRAGDIVKGMLQHSRSSSGKKEPTNINALADEYLRLAYHGLRAKDKSFNATIPIAIGTDFDETIGNINIIPQDIGRVILNLINNAFYAVNERQKLLAASHELLANYEPTVSISTKKEGNKVLISVKDNGSGIPQKILGKIFQPFFTTKPTGQGTGLGLSLSYDIVKAHGGELRVETREGEGSAFVILIPVS